MVREAELRFGGGGGRGGGRDQYRRDYHHRQLYESKFGEKSRNFHSKSGRFGGRSSGISNNTSNNALPSRHFWVGNLSHNLMESELVSHFLRFGDLESVAFQPGRSYVFLNFVEEEGAVVMLELP